MAKNKQNAQSTDPVINDILKRLEFVESRVGISPVVQESAPDATPAAPEDTASPPAASENDAAPADDGNAPTNENVPIE